jgi:hypothetical protein
LSKVVVVHRKLSPTTMIVDRGGSAKRTKRGSGKISSKMEVDIRADIRAAAPVALSIRPNRHHLFYRLNITEICLTPPALPTSKPSIRWRPH